jgi:enolase
MAEIEKIIGREIIDSRGFPTVEAEVHCIFSESNSSNFARASVPSGASTGKHEAHELRDGDNKRFLGKGVTKAAKNINTLISDHLKGHDTDDQENIDNLLVKLDGTKNKERLGANAILAVSIANYRFANKGHDYQGSRLPIPLINILNGGVHADNGLDIQEFMIVPVNADSFKHAIQISCEIFHTLKKILSDNSLSTNLGDEGGYAPQLKNHNEALDYLIKSIEKAGYKPGKDVYIALDAASSEFYKNNKYELLGEGKKFSSDELIKYYEKIISSYPIISIEDPMSEDDLDGWKHITKSLGNKIQLVGDDLFVTNEEKLQEGINNKIANSILIKLNQIGTVTETINAIDLAKKNNYSTIISHRSGETEDSFISDLACVTDAGQIKTGSTARSERLSKYNQLIRKEEFADTTYAGREIFSFLK